MNMQAALPLHAKPDVKVAIIGSGFSGLCMGIKLREAGYESFVIFEKADEVGGTWRENNYPGCACDVPSHLYSYSFEPKPDWSRAFSPQGEILEYLIHCGNKYGIREHIKFGIKVTHAAFDEAAGLWRVTTSDGKTITAQFLISGAGGLHIPTYPDIPGLEDFKGAKFHSAHWDHGFDMKGKRVAVIGTGASAIQFVPEIAPDVAQLTIIQRTAPWIMPKEDREYTAREKGRFKAWPWLRAMVRRLIYARLEWATMLFTSHPKIVQKGEAIGLKHIDDTVEDAATRKKVTPHFSLGCKRVLLSNDWYPALNRANVDLETSGVKEVRANSVVMADGREVEVDAIILGTGFKAMEMPEGLEIIGRGGRSMSEEWKSAPEAYLGITCTGYPNFFVMMGPNTGLGSNSMIVMIEAQVTYAMDAIRLMDMKNIAYMDVKPKAQRAFNDNLQKKMEHTVWTTGCNSWYQTASGHNAAIWPETTMKYWLKTRHVDESKYEAVKAPAATLASAAE